MAEAPVTIKKILNFPFSFLATKIKTPPKIKNSKAKIPTTGNKALLIESENGIMKKARIKTKFTIKDKSIFFKTIMC